MLSLGTGLEPSLDDRCDLAGLVRGGEAGASIMSRVRQACRLMSAFLSSLSFSTS